MSLARALTYAFLTIAGLGLLDEVAARLSDRVQFGIPLLAAPDFTADLVLRDSLGPRGKPNGHFQKWILNSAGFRSSEAALTPVPGCVRVMTLGSSETFGLTAESPGHEYPAQLADSLRGHGCYQVLNAGMAGIGLPSMIRLWNQWASRFRPDIVVITPNPILYLADQSPAPDTSAQSAPPWWTSRMLGKLRDALPYPDVLHEWVLERQLDDLTWRHAADWQYQTVPVGRLDRFRRDLDSLVTTVSSRGARPVLAAAAIRVGRTVAPGDRLDLEELRLFSARAPTAVALAFDSAAAGVVVALGQRTGAPVVDLPAVMNGRSALFSDAIHYTDAGAAVVAGQVSRVIEGMTPGRERP